MTKITLVGAGSVAFTKSLLCDILQFPALADCTIGLMDIDAERLATAERLAKRIVAQLGIKARVEASTDLRKACAGAKFAITTIQVGGYKPATVDDFEIPARYGVKQTIADTLGVGGIFRALRSIPPLVNVARNLQEVGAPDPLLINYTNPMAMNMWGIDRLTGINAVGLCHSVQGTSAKLAAYCDLPMEDVSYLVAGVNHMAFFLKFQYKGKDAYPLLFRALENPAVFANDRVRFEMMRRLGYFVTESSEHQSEYTPHFIHHGDEIIEKFRIPINEYIRRCEALVATWEAMEAEMMDESKPMEIKRSVEYGSGIIESMLSGTPRVVYGNVPNTGLITNLPHGCCVEVPCLVDKQGIQPTYVGNLPPQIASVIRTNVNVHELTVEAAATGRRDYIYQAAMADPHTAATLTLDKIWAMCDELIAVHQKNGYLGEFKPVAPNTGKPLSEVARVFLSVEPDGIPFQDSNESRFNLVAQNETGKPFQGEVGLKAEGAELLGDSKLTVNVSAGETATVPFTLRRAKEAALKIIIQSDSPATIDQDYHLPQRNRFTLPISADGKNVMPIEIDWSGNAVARGGAWQTPAGDLAIDLRISDTDVTAWPGFMWWEGSAVEFGLKDMERTDGLADLLLVVPGSEPQMLLNNAPISDGEVKVSIDPAGYSLSLRVPQEQVRLRPGHPFLMEIVCHVHALGTTHGKTCAVWQGSSGTINAGIKLNQTRFALVIPAAAII